MNRFAAACLFLSVFIGGSISLTPALHPIFGSSALTAPYSGFRDNRFRLLRRSPYGWHLLVPQ